METTGYTSVVFWNIWGSRFPDDLNERLLQFIREKGAEVLCLTEVSDSTVVNASAIIHTSTRKSEPPAHVNGLDRLKTALAEYGTLHYETPAREQWKCKISDTSVPDVGFGNVLMVRSSLNVIAQGSSVVFKDTEWEHKARVLQWVVFKKYGITYLVAHYHGVWFAENTKGDNEARILQSVSLICRLGTICIEYGVDKVIFGGDLNLDINTISLRLLEQDGWGEPTRRLRNLIREFGISNTRTPLYRKYDKPGETLYADYVLVGENVYVHSLEVDNNTHLSDHAPLCVSFV
jgi:hypothetical protein